MKRLIVLTKSPMHKEIGGELRSGACVVAYCPETRKLIRLTQEPEGAPLNGPAVRRFSVLDEIEVRIIRELPAPPQNENVLVCTEEIHCVGKSRTGICDIAQEYIPGYSVQFMEDSGPTLDSFSGNHSGRKAAVCME